MGLINTSVVIIYSLSSIFLNTVVGVNALWIGLLEGAVEGLSFLMKLFSGVFSDYLKKRKRLMIIGYALTVISKPLIGISAQFYTVFISRIIERLGNGIQSTPRDALIGDIAPEKLRGTCYGFQRGIGIVGSITGSFLAYKAMKHFQGDFQSVFLAASIPAFFALLLLIFFVREPRHPQTSGDTVVNQKTRHPIHFRDVVHLGRPFWLLMIVVAIFWVARVSETLIVLHAYSTLNLEVSSAPLIMMTYNITYCLSSFACGYFSDKIGRLGLMAWTIVVLMSADLIISSATSIEMLFLGVLVWGLQMGMSMNLFTAQIADLSPEALRGTAFGCYYLISAVATVFAGFLNGGISEHFGIATTFRMSMFVAAIALVTLLALLKRQRLIA